MAEEPTCSICKLIEPTWLEQPLNADGSAAHSTKLLEAGKPYRLELHCPDPISLNVSGPVKDVQLDPSDKVLVANFRTTALGLVFFKVTAGPLKTTYSLFLMHPPP